MSKVLTISIAAYNVEKYIEQNLDSILASTVREEIEVFVVDDGGKDGTLAIAKKFETRYPGIVHVIHKQNGGYGSVQNYSIAHATGKYFKILDGDDWVDTEGLTKLVRYLGSAETDVVITNYRKGPNPDSLTEFDFGVRDGGQQTFDVNELKTAIGMWALTFKMSILIQSGMVLPEHTLYTDRIYSTVPFSFAQNAVILGFPVYCYRTGRDGQSVSMESRIAHIDEYLNVTETICRHYAKDQRENKAYILLKATAAHKVSVRALLLLSANQKNLEKLKDYEKKIKSISPEIYKKSASLKTRMGLVITFMRMTKYMGYWILSALPKKWIAY